MRRRNYPICSAVLSVVLAAGGILSGCAGSGPSQPKESSSQAQEPAQQSQQSESKTEIGNEESKSGGENSLPIVSEKQTFRIAVLETSPLKGAADRQCVIDAEEATNIHIEWTEIPSSAWDEKINVMFSTGDLPDAIIGSVDLTRNYEQLAVLNDYLETSAPHVKEFFDSRDDYPNALYLPDGTIRSLPTGDETAANTIDSMLWINRTWLDALKLEMPKNTEELKKVLEAFRDGDPNGNGKKDEIPFTFQKAWGWGTTIENFFGPFGVVENGAHVFVQDGKVVFGAGEQGYYDALAYMHGLYADGLMDKDVFSIASDQYAARGASDGTVEILGLVAGYRPTEAGVLDQGNYEALPLLEGPEGKKMVMENNVTKTGGFCITNVCKDPEVLVRWYDYINSSMELALSWGRGAEGTFWKILEENGKKIPYFLDMSKQTPAFGGYASQSEYRSAESFAGQTPSLWRYAYFVDTKEEKGTDARLQAIYEQLKYSVKGLPAGMAVTAENAERRAILLTDIDTYLEKFIADSVINGIDDAKWQTHLKALESLKTAEYKDLCQEYVDALN